MSLSKGLDVSGNNRNLIVDQFAMDGLLSISAEEVVKTTKVPKKRTKKIPNSKFYNRLLECLDREEHPHMLRYVPNTNKSVFEVIFTDRKSKKNWDETDISLFKDLDDHLGEKFNRKRPPGENDCKSRFRSNMIKCQPNFVKIVSDIKRESKIIKTYRIISRPVEQQSGVDREVAGKSKRKLSKRTSKKQENKNIVPGFDDRYSEKSNTIVDSQKNESGETRYIWENSASKIISLLSFGKEDFSRNHYSCLSSDSQMDIDGKIASNVTNDYLNRNDVIEIINMEVPVYYSGVSTDVGVTTSYENSEEEVFSSSGEKEIMNCELPIRQSENLDFESNQPNAGMIYANSNPGYYSGVSTDVGVTISYGNSEEEVFSSSGEKEIMNCELPIRQSENLDFESNQPNAGMIYANSNVDDYCNSGVQADENQNEKNGQECLEYYGMDCEILKSNPLLCSAQNDFYDSSNSIGGNDDFANRFIRLGGAGALYP